MSSPEKFLIETADQLNLTVRTLRDLTDELERISNRLLAKAVELDTIRDKSRQSPDDTDENSSP